eukprot:TRINITY_DN5683_c0_g4_i1.p1 TRINITY_DN5683_c0_g4~~TRINITY_DN5683_c0_g4_i1.p1  ORF type:complete len:305 (+),score=22.71 TRINITY_DN5683_c0_g4_i1:55-969(+)
MSFASFIRLFAVCSMALQPFIGRGVRTRMVVGDRVHARRVPRARRSKSPPVIDPSDVPKERDNVAAIRSKRRTPPRPSYKVYYKGRLNYITQVDWTRYDGWVNMGMPFMNSSHFRFLAKKLETQHCDDALQNFGAVNQLGPGFYAFEDDPSSPFASFCSAAKYYHEKAEIRKEDVYVMKMVMQINDASEFFTSRCLSCSSYYTEGRCWDGLKKDIGKCVVGNSGCLKDEAVFRPTDLVQDRLTITEIYRIKHDFWRNHKLAIDQEGFEKVCARKASEMQPWCSLSFNNSNDDKASYDCEERVSA